jgi:hypothetical protein
MVKTRAKKQHQSGSNVCAYANDDGSRKTRRQKLRRRRSSHKGGVTAMLIPGDRMRPV